MKPSKDLVRALAVTCELTNTDLSESAAHVMAHDLAEYPLEQVLAALVRCRRELKGRLTIADVLQRLEDGRPGPEQAWAMVPRQESQSCFWTEEMRDAFFMARPLLIDGDTVQARMAFVESYKALLQRARDARKPVAWTFSPGTDPHGRAAAVREARDKGLISEEAAVKLLPYFGGDEMREKLLASGALKLIESKP